MSVQTFQRDLQRFAQKLDVEHKAATKKFTFDLLRRIVMKTPVDFGRARASWNVGVNRVDTSVMPEGTELSPAQAAQTAFDRATAALATSESLDTVFITNNLDYIVRLEEGHSKIQAPQGMLRVSIAEVQALSDQVLR